MATHLLRPVETDTGADLSFQVRDVSHLGLQNADPADAGTAGDGREISYDTGGGNRWFRHAGDTDFLTAWLRHPEFYLIK